MVDPRLYRRLGDEVRVRPAQRSSASRVDVIRPLQPHRALLRSGREHDGRIRPLGEHRVHDGDKLWAVTLFDVVEFEVRKPKASSASVRGAS